MTADQTDALKAHYPLFYGDSFQHNPPDYERCCKPMRDLSSSRRRLVQCSRRNGHGPDGAYCDAHDPERTAERQAASLAQAKARFARELALDRLYDERAIIIQQIAEGHADPQGLCRDWLERMKKAEDNG